MARAEKEQAVADLRDKLGRARAAVLTDYRGLDVTHMTELRQRLRAAGVEYRVVRNNLFRLASHQVGAAGLDPYLDGPTAVAFSYDDPVAVAKVLTAFAREFKLPALKGGWVEGTSLDAEAVARLAELPGREVLIARVMGAFQAPVTGMVFCLGGLLRNFVYALDALRRQREETASA